MEAAARAVAAEARRNWRRVRGRLRILGSGGMGEPLLGLPGSTVLLAASMRGEGGGTSGGIANGPFPIANGNSLGAGIRVSGVVTGVSYR